MTALPHLRTSFISSVVLLLILLTPAALAEKISEIRPSGYVIDLAGAVDAATKQRIEDLATQVEQKTGAQIAVVTVKSLDGQSRDEYAVDLFKHLGVGHKDDRGVLLLLAPQERQYKIEVGYGLEPVINDARAGDIGREMVPMLRNNNYSGAVELAANRLAELIAADKGVDLGKYTAPPEPVYKDYHKQFPWWLVVVGVIVLLKILGAVIGGGRGRRRRPGWWIFPPMGGGGWSGGGGWGGSSGGFSSGGGGFGGFGGGSSGGGGAGGSW